jgi:hypothetical protein
MFFSGGSTPSTASRGSVQGCISRCTTSSQVGSGSGGVCAARLITRR